MITKMQFRAARRLLERDGWCQGLLECYDGAKCLVGALLETSNSEDIVLWSRELGAFDSEIVKWNDAPGRTLDEVRALLTFAEEAARC